VNAGNRYNNSSAPLIGLYAWTALAGRALVPGVQADMAVILKSEQGTVKTQGIKAMAPFVQAFGEIDLGKGDDVLARQTRGKLVCEISELRGLNSREHGAIKSWISRTHEEWVPKFKEFAAQFPRRFICFGTTNEDEFLADATGERRWLPMVVGRTKLAALKADVEQLWAEGVHLFRKGGVQWAAAEELAKREHSRFKVQDSWHDVISNWLNDEAFGDLEGICQGDSPVRMHQLLQSALNLNVQNIARKDELRAGAVLRSLGYEPTTIRLPSVFLAKNEVKCNARTSIAGRREEHYANVYRAWVNKSREDAARALRELV
jgi:predicted P-loop ATPase